MTNIARRPQTQRSTEMANSFWIKTDIDGRGRKFRLAIRRGEMIYFPVEDFEDYFENYTNDSRYPIISPETSGASGWVAAEILAERRRQIEEEGWSLKRDDILHRNGELVLAASCYVKIAGFNQASHRDRYQTSRAPISWPWADEWWKPKNPRSDLIRAAALIVAEIERLDRAEAKRDKEKS